jgi:hypothetical protein
MDKRIEFDIEIKHVFWLLLFVVLWLRFGSGVIYLFGEFFKWLWML